MPLNIEQKIIISEQDYLTNELHSEIKHEYIDGYVYAMAGASKNHNKITSNVLFELKSGLRKKDDACVVYAGDMRVNIASKYFYPDVMVVCNKNDNKSEYYTTTPVILVEVLSASTRKSDMSTKRFFYQNIPSLKEYVLIEQDYAEIQVCRKKQHWQPNYYYLGDNITFDSIDVTISVEDIYYQVNNQNMLDYLKNKS